MLSEAEGELVAQAALDAIAGTQERFLDGELVRVEVKLIIRTAAGLRHVTAIQTKS